MTPRTPADALAEAKSEAAFDRLMDYAFHINRRPRSRAESTLEHDVRVAAAALLADAGSKLAAMDRAREFAEASAPDEETLTGHAAVYFWALVRGCVEFGAVLR